MLYLKGFDTSKTVYEISKILDCGNPRVSEGFSMFHERVFPRILRSYVSFFFWIFRVSRGFQGIPGNSYGFVACLRIL